MELCDMSLDDYLHPKSTRGPTNSLPYYVKGGGTDSIVQMWTVMSQIAGGVEYIHGEHQIHRDIKPGNVLYSSKASVWKLADFGLSSEGSSKGYLRTKDSSGTPGYRAPELMDSGGDPAMYNNRVDIWAMGCILYELVTGVRAFKSDWHVLNLGFTKKNVEVVLDDSFDAHCVQIITKHIVDTLQIDPSDRPSASTMSKKFDQQLQLAHHTTVTDSVTLVPKSKSHQNAESEFVRLAVSVEELSLEKVRITLPAGEDVEEDPPATKAEIWDPELKPAPSPMPKPKKYQASGNSVPLPAVINKTEQKPAPTPMPRIHPDNPNSITPPAVMNKIEQTAATPQKNQIGANPAQTDAPSLRPHLQAVPLYYAAEKGDIEAVKALLDAKAKVNAQGGTYGNALQVASVKGHEAVVRLVLEKGADVNAQGGRYGNALQTASFWDREKIVRLLLDNGAEVNAKGGHYETALQGASHWGYISIVRLLLEKGADVNAQGGDYGTALLAASVGGDESTVRLLLEKGANVNAQGGKCGNALQAASSVGREWIVRLLLEKGADVNAQGGKYGSAVKAASKKGHKAVVRLLVESGAIKPPSLWKRLIG